MPSAVVPDEGVGMLGAVVRLRGVRDYWLLWVSQVLSAAGSRATSVAMPLLVLTVTGSPTQAGVVGAAATAPYLLVTLPAGAWVDRWPRRRLMALCAAGRAVALASVVAAVGLHTVHVVHLALAAALDGALFVVFDLAEGAALPHVVPEPLLPAAVGQNETRRAAAALVGQPAGGALFGIDRALPFLLDAMSSAMSIAAVLALRGPLQGPRAARGRRLREEVGEGLVLVWRDRFLRSASILIGAANVVFGAVPLLLLLRAQQRGATPAFVGLLFGVEAAAGVLGALPAARLRTVLPGRMVVVAVLTVWALVLLGLSLLAGLLPLAVGAALLGLLNPLFNTVLTSEVYRITPPVVLGRVRSAARLLGSGGVPVGAMLGGWLAAALGAGSGLGVVGVLLLGVAAAALRSTGVRSIGSSDVYADRQPPDAGTGS